MKHTQGNWEVDKQSGGVTYIRANKDYLATIHTAYDGKNNTQKEMESEANANLIASAPETYKVAKQVVDYIEGNGIDKWSDEDKDDCFVYALYKYYAKSAVAKAEGK